MKGKVRRRLDDGSYEVDTEAGVKKVDAGKLRKPGDSSTPAAPADVKFFQYELEGGVVTINEVRASKGLPRDSRFGDMTLPDYIASNAKTFKAAAEARTTGAAAKEKPT